MFEEIGSVKNVKPWFEKALKEKRKIMGMGHRVYKAKDPRAFVLEGFLTRIAEKTGGNENYYRGQGFGTGRSTPYPDSATHRTPATTVNGSVERTSAATARRVAAGLKRVRTRRAGARALGSKGCSRA